MHKEEDASYMHGNITLCHPDNLKDHRIDQLTTLPLSGAKITFNDETNARESHVDLSDTNHDQGTRKALGGDVPQPTTPSHSSFKH